MNPEVARPRQLEKPEDRAKMFGPVDSVARFEGEVGYGLFKELLDGAATGSADGGAAMGTSTT